MDVIIVGANIGGSVAAGDLAASGANVTLLERDLARKKPCGGAIPPKAVSEFGIPNSIIERKTTRAVMIGPSGTVSGMDVRGTRPREDDYICMVTRERLDRAMREKAQEAGADLREASFVSHEEDAHGKVHVKIRYRGGREETLVADALVGADGAGSTVAKSCGRPAIKHASAIQERLELSPTRRWNTIRIRPNSTSATTSRPTSTVGCFPRAITWPSVPVAARSMPIAPTRFSKA
ncbi:MAG: FAD-dependent monooxygenase [Candidatus Eremiobacteraeota bacterium]|nr:FAD-dependent monooxygenase [Candidatus Eremiobacteraeota bacterium]